MSFGQLGELGVELDRIDGLQREVNALKSSRAGTYKKLMRQWVIESTYNSNNIEGSTLSLGETALLYEGERVDAPADDVRQAEGGFAALRFLDESLAGCADFDEQLIKRAHELAYAEAKDAVARGSYRTCEVEITGTSFEPAPAEYVAERMADLVRICNGSSRHPVMVAALFHLEFESIHPFVNANGRTGRLMSNYLLMRAGYEPVNIQAESRAHYIAAIRSFQCDDDPYPFAAFFCQCVEERLEFVIERLHVGGGCGDGRGTTVVDWLAE